MTIADISRLLAPLRTRIANVVARAVVQLVHDGGRMQVTQLNVLSGETREGCERFQEYGLTSVPLPGAEAVVLFVGGRRDHGLVVAVDDRRYRPTGLEPGEVCLYSQHGQRITLKNDGAIELEPATGKSIVLAGGSAAVARLGDATLGHTHTVVCGGAGVTVTSAPATDTIAQGAARVKA